MNYQEFVKRLEQACLNYMYEMAELQASGETLIPMTPEQLMLAELIGFHVNLKTGTVGNLSEQKPYWLRDLLAYHERTKWEDLI